LSGENDASLPLASPGSRQFLIEAGIQNVLLASDHVSRSLSEAGIPRVVGGPLPPFRAAGQVL